MRRCSLIGWAIVSAISTATLAAPPTLYPVQTGAEVVRFRQGVPTLDLEVTTGAIQITPLPFDHGHVSFGLGVYNKSGLPANFGIENVVARIANEDVPVLGVHVLEKRAKSRAMWTQIGIAVLTSGLAGAASTAYTTNRSYGHARTPFGSYSWQTSYRDNSVGLLGATAATASGVGAIAGVQNRLDYTLANLAKGIVQTTTLDPDSSYGGRIVLEKPKGKVGATYDVQIQINWNGARYPFVFRVTDQEANIPPAYTIAPRPVPDNPAPTSQPFVTLLSPAINGVHGIVPRAGSMTIASADASSSFVSKAAVLSAPMSKAAMDRAAYLRGQAQARAQLAAIGEQ